MRLRLRVSARIGAIPDELWAPAAACVLILLVGATSLVAKCPWVFPSLGPTAFMQVEWPQLRSARMVHVVAGHLLGLASGLFAVHVLGVAGAPPATAGEALSPLRLAAVALCVPIAIALQLLLRASHPPAIATGLLIAIGAFPANAHTVATVAIGVLLVAVPGELLRRSRLGARLRR